jgi:hypothetical protein
MKPIELKPGTASLPLMALLFCSMMACAHAQNFTIDWYEIAGGGGTSTGSVYSLTGTIGQPDASGAMSGGSFSVTGGFWSLISVVQTVGAPSLTITHSGNNIKVSWPSPSTGFMLQQNSNPATANWTTSGFTIANDGTNNSLTLTAVIASRGRCL